MQVSVTILVENTTPAANMIGEYGFACLVSVDGSNLLFDTGSNQALFHNSQALDIKLGEISDVVISHGHFDHTGALLALLNEYGDKRIYAHPRLLLPRYFSLNDGSYREIGSPNTRKQLEQAGAQFIWADTLTEIIPGVYISGEIPKYYEFEDVGGDFRVEVDGQMEKDDLNDDMALIIDRPQGLIIISGCAHAGFLNTIEHASRLTGKTKILAYIGGTHLMSASSSRLDQTVAALKSYDIDRLIVAHCTGFYAAARLFNELGEKVIKGETGMSFSF